MNDLQAIAFAEHCLSPVVPADDFAVEFDCNSRRRKREFTYQITQGRLIGNISTLAVDLDAQFILLPFSPETIIPAK